MRFIYDKIDIKKIVMIYLISWTSYIDEGKTWIRLHKPAPPLPAAILQEVHGLYRLFEKPGPINKEAVKQLNWLDHYLVFETPLPKDNLCQAWFVINVFSQFRHLLGKGREQTWFPFTQGCFVPGLVELAQWL